MVMTIQDSGREHPLYWIGAFLQALVVANPLAEVPSEVRIWRDDEKGGGGSCRCRAMRPNASPTPMNTRIRMCVR